MIKLVKPYQKEIIDNVACLRHENGNDYSEKYFLRAIEKLKNSTRELYVEFGVPSIKDMTYDEAIRRQLSVDQNNICGIIDRGSIEFKNNTIFADVTPYGPFSKQLSELTNPVFSM